MRLIILLAVLLSTVHSSSLIRKPMRKFRLKPGSILYYQENTKSDMVYFGMSAQLPSSFEKSNLKPGVAALLLSYLKTYDERLDGYTHQEALPVIFWESDTLASSLRVSTGFLKEDYQTVLGGLFTLWFEPQWNEEVFTQLKKRYIKDLGVLKSDAVGSDALMAHSLQTMYPNAAYGLRLSPNVDEVAKITLKDIKELHKVLFNPLRLNFCLSGDLPLKPVIDILHGSLSLLQAENIGLNNAIQAREITEKRHYIETDESAAMISFFGPERSHKDSLGFRFLSHLLSVGFNGALAKSIERQMGIYDWQLAVGSTDSGFTLHLYYRDEKNQPHIFAEQFFKVLELFKNRLVSDVELHRAKNLAKNDLFALESKKVIQAMEIASDSMGDYRYVLESDYLSYIDSLTREDVQELCKKYLDLNSYHYHSVEPLSNKNSGDISVTEFDIEGLQVILEEDPNQDVIGVSWSYELVENSHPLIPYVGAWSLCEGPLIIENKTLEEKLSELSQLFHGAPMSDRLYFSGQITPNQWGEEFLALLPYLLLDRVVNQEHVKHSVTRVEEQMSQSSEDRWSDDWFYKEIFPDSQFMHPYLYDVNHLSSVKFPAVYEYVRSLLKLHRIRLVISGNFHKENVRNSLQNYFTSFSKLNKRVFPAGIDRQDGKTSIKQKMKSLYSRFSDKLKRKSKEVSNTKQPKDCDKTLVVDGEHFYQFIGDVYDAEEFRVEEEAAFVLLGLSLDNEVYDGVTFKDFEVSLSYDLTGEHLRALLKISGLNKDRKQILDHVENILKECAGEIEADSSALDFVRKQVRLKKAYTMQDRAARAFWMNRAVSTGLGQSYGVRFLEALKKLGHQDIKAIFKKRFQRKYQLLYAPVK